MKAQHTKPPLHKLLRIDHVTLWRWGRTKAPYMAKLACLTLQRQGDIEEIPEFLKLGEDQDD